MVQGSGSGFLVSNSGKSFQIGSYILISGLALQVTAFAFFTITAIRFDIKYKREFGLDGRERYVALLYCLYVSCLCILVSFYFVYSVLFYFPLGWFGLREIILTPAPFHTLPACGFAESGSGSERAGVYPIFIYLFPYFFLFLLDFIGACISAPLHP